LAATFKAQKKQNKTMIERLQVNKAAPTVKLSVDKTRLTETRLEAIKIAIPVAIG